MFFAASKLIWPLLSPLNLLLVLFVFGAGLAVFCRRAGMIVVAATVGLYLLIGIVPIGPALLAGIENRYERPETMPEKVDGIIILGGVFEVKEIVARGVLIMNDGAERMVESMRLARLYPDAKLIFSGGQAEMHSIDHSEGTDSHLFMKEYVGRDPDVALYEEKSRNTYENAIFTREMIKPEPGQRWILVTSAYHFPRAIAVFEHAGWTGIIPWPVDYRTDGSTSILPRELNAGGNFLALNIAIHEYVGMLAYKLTGKIGKISGKPPGSS